MKSFFGKGIAVLLGFGLFVALLGASGKLDEVVVAFQDATQFAAENAPAGEDIAGTVDKSVDVADDVESSLPSGSSIGSALAAASAHAALSSLATVSGDAGGYTSGAFGDGWVDVNRNGCSTFNDIVERDSTERDKPGKCVIKSGNLIDAYTGTAFAFAHKDQTVAVDRLVSTTDAWATGASTWNSVELAKFANDPLNLVAVHASSASAHAEASAATWLPARPFACDIAGRQIIVKTKYKLGVTEAERSVLSDMLGACILGKE